MRSHRLEKSRWQSMDHRVTSVRWSQSALTEFCRVPVPPPLSAPQSSLEHDVYSRLSSLQEGLIPKKRAGADDDLHRINELIQVPTRPPCKISAVR